MLDQTSDQTLDLKNRLKFNFYQKYKTFLKSKS